jgi:hypothetical protein
VPVPCFMLFLCFRKVTQEIFLELDETKVEVPNYLTRRRSPKKNRRRTRGQPHPVVVRARPRLSHQGVWPPSPPPNIALSPINPLDGKTLGPELFSRKYTASRRVINARSGGSRSSFQHPAGVRNHHQRPSSSPCLPPE